MPIVECALPGCKNTFERKQSNINGNTFCSRTCGGKARDSRVKLKCNNCGKDFLIKKSHAEGTKYCSRKCVFEGRQNLKPILKCKKCGIEFKPRGNKRALSGETKYCSRECSYNDKAPDIIINCLNCKKDFVAPHKNKARNGQRLFCSRFCHGEHERLSNPIEKRFWEKVDVKGPDECWIFNGARNEFGYGQIWNGKRMFIAHRFAYIDKIGPIPDNLMLLHSCDVPYCVNPNHLTPGTHLQNMQDMAKKGRASKLQGEKHPKAKFTEAQILLFRQEFANGMKKADIGKKYNIDRHIIGNIIDRLTWKHI